MIELMALWFWLALSSCVELSYMWRLSVCCKCCKWTGVVLELVQHNEKAPKRSQQKQGHLYIPAAYFTCSALHSQFSLVVPPGSGLHIYCHLLLHQQHDFPPNSQAAPALLMNCTSKSTAFMHCHNMRPACKITAKLKCPFQILLQARAALAMHFAQCTCK